MYFTVATSYQHVPNQIINPPNSPSKVTIQPRTPNLASGINLSRGLIGSPGPSQLFSSIPQSSPIQAPFKFAFVQASVIS